MRPHLQGFYTHVLCPELRSVRVDEKGIPTYEAVQASLMLACRLDPKSFHVDNANREPLLRELNNLHDPYAPEPKGLLQRYNSLENNVRNLHLCTLLACALNDVRATGVSNPVVVVHGLGHYYDCEDVVKLLLLQ